MLETFFTFENENYNLRSGTVGHVNMKWNCNNAINISREQYCLGKRQYQT